MADIGEDLENLFLAGLGVAAYAAEQGKQLADELTAKGRVAVSQSQKLNSELHHDAEATARVMREIELEARMRAMTPEERRAYAEAAARFAQKQNTEDTAVGASDSVPTDDDTQHVQTSVEGNPAQEATTAQDANRPID